MRVFTRKGAGETDLERRLRAERPEAPPELVAAAVARIRERPAPRNVVRLGLALSTVGAVAVVFASLGGAGYASSATHQIIRKLETVVQSKSSTREAVPMSPGQAQYGPVPVPPYPPPRPTPPPAPSPPPPPTPPPPSSGGGTPGGGGTAGQGQGQGSPGSSTGVAGANNGQTQPSGSELPFTGLSLSLPAGLAILLIGGGIFLRRRSRRLSD
jgi:hypothetical protein